MSNRISVLVVLVLLLQHPFLVLVFKQKLCLSLARWFERLASFFSPILQQQLLSQLLPHWGVACPQVLQISSVVHQPSCFYLAPFFCSKVRGLLAGSLLSACYAGLLIIFQICNVIWLWMLLTVSGYELCGPLSVLFQAAAYHPPTVSHSAFPVFVYWKFMWRSAPCFFPLLQLT
jgi:hypothetical protein